MASIIETVMMGDNFTTLVDALQAANLVDTLSGPGPFTVFAPTDDAFDDLPAGLLDDLMEDSAMLRRVLAYHVISGSVTSDNIKNLNIDSAATLEGENLAIDVSILGRVQVNDAAVTRADIMCDNGVIHVVDAVLIPASMRGELAA
ncbi:MAG: fasciclin domain-containing protein [Armatimonadota bacterium]